MGCGLWGGGGGGLQNGSWGACEVLPLQKGVGAGRQETF